MTLMEEYIKRITEADTLSEINDIVEEAANDDRITNEEYQKIYSYALDMV